VVCIKEAERRLDNGDAWEEVRLWVRQKATDNQNAGNMYEALEIMAWLNGFLQGMKVAKAEELKQLNMDAHSRNFEPT
jgi:hypothetical protein